MNEKSELSSDVRLIRSGHFEVSLLCGWGWFDRLNNQVSEMGPDLILGKVIRFEFLGLIDVDVKIRGIRGRITEGPNIFLNRYLFAFSMSDGCNYDFWNRPCEFWRLYFLEEYQVGWTTGREIHGNVIAGWGGKITQL